DALDQALVRLEIAEHANKDDESDRDPELGFKHRRPQRLSTLLTAWPTSSLAGATPVSRSTMAPAVSTAMSRRFAIAEERVAAMAFSASAIRSCSFASTSLRRASAASPPLPPRAFAGTLRPPPPPAHALS